MKQTNPLSGSQTIALERFALMTKIQDALREGIPLSKALEEAAACPVDLHNGSGPRLFSPRTIEDWWYSYQKNGFGALQPQGRSDKGQPRSLNGEQQQMVLQQVRANLNIPITVLYRRWKEQDQQFPAINSVYRLLQAHDLHTRGRRYQQRQTITGPTKNFEAPFVNDLWMTDFSPGPFLHQPATSKAQPTHLCLIVDDHSRLIVYGAYYPRADTHAFHQTLKEAVRRRGLPGKLYTDQGGPFTNDHTRIVCANLGIRLLHAKPYHAWSKGKVERLFHTIQQDFEKLLRLPGEGAADIDGLNGKFSRWVQTVYHPRTHSATGQSPAQRFDAGSDQIRLLDPAMDLDRLFFTRLFRSVRKDGTIRLGNSLYEVDLSLRGMKVQLDFDPFDSKAIHVTYRGQSFGTAKPVNPHLNSQIHGSQHYEKQF